MIAVKVFAFLFVAVMLAEAKAAGDIQEQDASNPEYKKMLLKVMEEQNSDDRNEIINIKDVKTQVVSGTKFYIDFEVENRNTHETKRCKAVFVSQPWVSKEFQYVKLTC